MINQTSYLQQPRLLNIFKILVFLLAAIYLVNLFTPLRLHVDTIRYYLIKDCLEYGCDPKSDAASDYLPYGYTGLLLLLSKLHILKSFSIVLINLVYLFAGVYFVQKIFAGSVNKFVLLAIVLLNWTTIKFATHPLSEMQYLFFSMAALYFFSKFRLHRKAMDITLAFVFGGLAFMTRTVGITLFAALVCGVLWIFRDQLWLIIKKNKLILIALLLCLFGVVIFSKQLGLNHYTGVLNKEFSEGKTFKKIFEWRFTEWAEMFFNVPSTKVVDRVPGGLGTIVFVVLGLGVVVLFLVGLFRNKNMPFFIKAYLLFYTLLMFNWPFYDPRFWVPVLPLIAVVFLQIPLQAKGLVRSVSLLFLAAYAVIGVLACVVYTSNIFDKEKFSRTQAIGVYRNEYEIHFFGKPQSDTAHQVHQEVVHILERYD